MSKLLNSQRIFQVLSSDIPHPTRVNKQLKPIVTLTEAWRQMINSEPCYSSYNLDHLGLIAGMVDELGLSALIDTRP